MSIARLSGQGMAQKWSPVGRKEVELLSLVSCWMWELEGNMRQGNDPGGGPVQARFPQWKEGGRGGVGG